MVAAVIPFAMSDLYNLTLTIGLAIAILLDALIVRPVLLPAAVELLGRRAWWPTSRSAPHPPKEPKAPTNGGGRFAPREQDVVTKVWQRAVPRRASPARRSCRRARLRSPVSHLQLTARGRSARRPARVLSDCGFPAGQPVLSAEAERPGRVYGPPMATSATRHLGRAVMVGLVYWLVYGRPTRGAVDA